VVFIPEHLLEPVYIMYFRSCEVEIKASPIKRIVAIVNNRGYQFIERDCLRELGIEIFRSGKISTKEQTWRVLISIVLLR
jgi:hypothetical protein